MDDKRKREVALVMLNMPNAGELNRGSYPWRENGFMLKLWSVKAIPFFIKGDSKFPKDSSGPIVEIWEDARPGHSQFYYRDAGGKLILTKMCAGDCDIEEPQE
jgi:hypothetical protein